LNRRRQPFVLFCFILSYFSVEFEREREREVVEWEGVREGPSVDVALAFVEAEAVPAAAAKIASAVASEGGGGGGGRRCSSPHGSTVSGPAVARATMSGGRVLSPL
jgi:hypothetical protein